MTIVPMPRKNGQMSYRVQVCVKDVGTGRYITKTTTWIPDDKVGKVINDRNLNEFAVEFEKKVRNVYEMGLPGKVNITVEEYSKIWLEHLKETRSPSYYSCMKTNLVEINKKLGKYKLKQLTPIIIQRYIDSVKKECYTQIEVLDKKLIAYMKANKLSKTKLSAMSGVCTGTILKVERGINIDLESAEKIAKALKMDVDDLFTINNDLRVKGNATQAKRVRCLRAMLGQALKQQYVEHNYASGDYVDSIHEERKEKIFLDDKEIRTLLINLKNYPNMQAKVAIETLVYTGIRRGELCGLEWSDINFETGIMNIERSSKMVSGQGVITGKTKTQNSKRKIIMPQTLIDELKNYKKWWDKFVFLLGDEYKGCKRLFLQEDGSPLYPSTLRYWFKKMLQEFGLKDVTIHSLRHSNITIQLAAGVPLKTVSARAGHSTTKVTADIYAHMITSSDREAASTIDKVLNNDFDEDILQAN